MSTFLHKTCHERQASPGESSQTLVSPPLQTAKSPEKHTAGGGTHRRAPHQGPTGQVLGDPTQTEKVLEPGVRSSGFKVSDARGGRRAQANPVPPLAWDLGGRTTADGDVAGSRESGDLGSGLGSGMGWRIGESGGVGGSEWTAGFGSLFLSTSPMPATVTHARNAPSRGRGRVVLSQTVAAAGDCDIDAVSDQHKQPMLPSASPLSPPRDGISGGLPSTDISARPNTQVTHIHTRRQQATPDESHTTPSSPQTVGDDSGPCLPVHPIPVRLSIRFLHPFRSEPLQVSHGCPLPGTLRGTPQCGRWLDHACPRSRASGIPELRRQTPISSPAVSYTDGATGNG